MVMILRHLPFIRVLILIFLAGTPFAQAQSVPRQLSAVLDSRLQTPDVVAFQLRKFLIDRVAKLQLPSNAEQWTARIQQLRKHLLDDVVFHGWPEEWAKSSPKFEDLGPISSGQGYR